MSHVRCFAHALVTAVALVSWGGVVWMGLYHGTVADPLRMFGLALVGIAVGASSLALFPVVVIGYLKRYTDLIDTKTGIEAAWNLGCAHGRREERRKLEVLHDPITPRARFKVVENR